MTDATSFTTTTTTTPPAHHAASGSLVLLSLSSPPEGGSPQPAFDPAAALVAAATADDSSVEEVVLLRLLVLRRAHPDATVRTHLERVDGDQVVLRAEITLTSGASASAYATAGGGVASIELAERRALARALDALGESVLLDTARTAEDAGSLHEPHPAGTETPGEGFGGTYGVLPDLDIDAETWDDDDAGTEPSPEDDADEDAQRERQSSPREIPPPRFSPQPPRTRPGAETEREGAPHEPSPTTAPPPAVVDAVRRANLRRPSSGPSGGRPTGEPTESNPAPERDETTATPAPAPAAVDDPDDPPLEHYSWTAFWRVARPLGLDKMKVEELIGGPITSMTPLQVREKLKAAGVDI